MEKTKKTNIFLALLLSFLTSLLGAVVFGVVYALGYYIYLLAILEIVISCKVFLKFCSKKNFTSIFFALIWTILLVFIFNVASILVCETFFLMKDYPNESFINVFKLLLESWKDVEKVRTFINTRVIEVAAMIVVGGIVYGLASLIHNKKNRKSPQIKPFQSEINKLKHSANEIKNNENLSYSPTQQKQTEEKKEDKIIEDKSQSNTSSETKAINYYYIIEKCREALKVYTADKDMEKLTESMNNIKRIYVSSLSIPEKQSVVAKAVEQQNNPNLPKIERKAIEILLKMIN